MTRLRQDNLVPRVRERPPKMLLVFEYPPTEAELAWVMEHLPEGIRRANLKLGVQREFEEVIYTSEAQLATLEGKHE